MTKAIGLIDSGVGGLTVLKEALKQLPHESMIFLGDSARCPYGNRPVEEIRRFTWEMVQYLLKQGVKMIVIACNTATAVVLEELQQKLSIPVVGVIQPGSLAAIKQTKNKQIAVLGTKATITSDVYRQTLLQKNHQLTVTSLACPKFVPLVESHQTDSAIAKKVVAESLQPLAGKEFDTLILGCTHYPLLKARIQAVVGPNVQLIDSGAETVSTVSALLDFAGIAENYHTNPNPTVNFYTTGSPVLFSEIAKEWLERENVIVEKVKLEPMEEQSVNKELVIATKNAGKAKEFAAIFEPKGYTVKTLLDYPELDEVEETGKTFEENARLKAETIAEKLQKVVLADDSGLCVDALDGRPGIFSARYAGIPKSDAANNAKLLAELGEFPDKTRSAHFHCCLVMAAPNAASLVVEGTCSGEIAKYPSGTSGFGYDPIFYVPELGKTFAELGMEEKNQISHRAKAVEQLEQKWFDWIQKLEK